MDAAKLEMQAIQASCSHPNTTTKEGYPGGMRRYYQFRICLDCGHKETYSESQTVFMGEVYTNTQGEPLFKPGTAAKDISSGN